MKNFKNIDPFEEENWEEDKKDDILNKLKDLKFYYGRMLSWSKSTYRKSHPNNLVIFNSNIFTEEFGKIWYGDLDLTLDSQKLIDIYNEFKINFYVLHEMDGRFENENTNEFKKLSIWDTKNGLSDKMKPFFNDNLLRNEPR